MERTHGKLRAGFADGLRGDDADGFAGVHRFAGGEVHAVAAGAYAAAGLAGENAANLNARNTVGGEELRVAGHEQAVGIEQHLTGFRIDHRLSREAAVDVLAERVNILIVLRILGI